MKKSMLSAVALAATLAASPALAATTVINVNGVTNASLDGSNAVTVSLAAGTYRLNFVQDTFTAFTRFNSVSGCDANGANCATGFENSVRYIINGVTFGFGDGNANGGIGPIDPGNAYYATAAQSFANATGYLGSFTLAAPGDVSFYIADDNLGDNSGGVSLAAAIPEPATWALMILGFGFIGGAMRYGTRATKVAFA